MASCPCKLCTRMETLAQPHAQTCAQRHTLRTLAPHAATPHTNTRPQLTHWAALTQSSLTHAGSRTDEHAPPRAHPHPSLQALGTQGVPVRLSQALPLPMGPSNVPGPHCTSHVPLSCLEGPICEGGMHPLFGEGPHKWHRGARAEVSQQLGAAQPVLGQRWAAVCGWGQSSSGTPFPSGVWPPWLPDTHQALHSSTVQNRVGLWAPRKPTGLPGPCTRG